MCDYKFWAPQSDIRRNHHSFSECWGQHSLRIYRRVRPPDEPLTCGTSGTPFPTKHHNNI